MNKVSGLKGAVKEGHEGLSERPAQKNRIRNFGIRLKY